MYHKLRLTVFAWLWSVSFLTVFRQTDGESCSLSFRGLYFYFAVMGFYNIISQAQSQACALTGRFGGKERLKDLIQDLLRNAVSIVYHVHFNPVTIFF